MIGRLLRPLHRFVVLHIDVEDPWEPAGSFLVTHQRFGPGSTRPFSWYFEGESRVQVSDLDGICQWLTECQYVRDAELFREADYWQHPITFEHLRRGDCEDHALWAWRKVTELGHKAQLFVGQWFPEPKNPGHHAWLVFERGDETFLLEPVTKDPQQILRPLAQARAEYLPHYSVDSAFRMSARYGLLAYWRELELKRRAAKKKERGLTTA